MDRRRNPFAPGARETLHWDMPEAELVRSFHDIVRPINDAAAWFGIGKPDSGAVHVNDACTGALGGRREQRSFEP